MKIWGKVNPTLPPPQFTISSCLCLRAVNHLISLRKNHETIRTVYTYKYGLLPDYVPTKVCIKTFVEHRHFSRMSSFPVQDELIFLAYT